jgi:hypothetical protein
MSCQAQLNCVLSNTSCEDEEHLYAFATSTSFFTEGVPQTPLHVVAHHSPSLVFPRRIARCWCCHQNSRQISIWFCVFPELNFEVGIATGYGLDDREVGVRVLVRSRISSSPTYLIGTGGSFPGVRRPGQEADHSQLVQRSRKMWLYISTPPKTPSWRKA